jgi:uncharacterized protein (TIGR00106 family)
MIVAEMRAVPVGTGSSMEETVDAVREALDDCDVKYEIGPVGTTFEVDNMEDLLETVQCCHEAALETAPRIVFTVTIDQRKDSAETIDTLRGATRRSRSRGGRGTKDRGSSNPRANAKGQRRAKASSEGNPRAVTRSH